MILSLANTPGVSGAEQSAADLARTLLMPICDTVSIDHRGSVVGRIGGIGKHIQLDAHIDQVGLIVTDIAGAGFVKFDKCGSTDTRVLPGMEVTILGEESIFGVVTSIPPHLAKKEDDGKAKAISDLAIDTGLSTDNCERLIHRGDRVVLKAYPADLLGTQITSRAFDDRSGVASIIRALEIVKESKKSHPSITVTFSACEEVSGRGAQTASFDETIDEAIAVDVSFAYTPGCDKSETSTIGSGPMVGISPVLSHSMSKMLEELATQNEIPFQLEIMSGRTSTHADELAVTKAGIPSALISIPLKYMHTPCEVIDIQDVENTAKLIAAYILKGE